MGVRGLQTFMERNGACYEVNIPQEVAWWKRNNDHPPVIVVDAMACMNQLYAELSWILGGQMKEFEEKIRRFVGQFHSLDVQLVFFFDGPACDVKLDVWKRRRYARAESFEVIFDRLNSGESLEDVESDSDKSTPSGVNWFTGVLVKSLGCEVITSVAECDAEVAKYCRENQCLAVLSQDSDYAIYDFGRYWSMNHFKVDTMTTLEYNRNELANVLGISPLSLPLFASLSGNDIVSFDLLRNFHWRIRNGRRGHPAYFISSFVAKYPYGFNKLQKYLREIAETVFNDESQWKLLKDSLDTYRVNRQLCNPYSTVCEEDGNWEEILQTVLYDHTTAFQPGLFNIVFLQNYFSGNSFEDYRLDDLPLYQEALVRLRQLIYGILLYECSYFHHRVNELVMGGPGSIDDFTVVAAIPPEVYHPGLLALWNSEDESFDEDRWNLLCSSVCVDESLIHRVPRQYRILLLSLKYLLDEYILVEGWEIEAVIATAVSLPSYSVSNLRNINIQSVNFRCVRLYALVLKTCSTMRLLNFSCGSPIPEDFTLPTYYQDGKLFHQMYEFAEDQVQRFNRNPRFNLRGEAKHHFNVLMGTLNSM